MGEFRCADCGALQHPGSQEEFIAILERWLQEYSRAFSEGSPSGTDYVGVLKLSLAAAKAGLCCNCYAKSILEKL